MTSWQKHTLRTAFQTSACLNCQKRSSLVLAWGTVALGQDNADNAISSVTDAWRQEAPPLSVMTLTVCNEVYLQFKCARRHTHTHQPFNCKVSPTIVAFRIIQTSPSWGSFHGVVWHWGCALVEPDPNITHHNMTILFSTAHLRVCFWVSKYVCVFAYGVCKCVC